MYYYDQTCTINGITNYFCLYQFFDPATQNCGNVQSTTGIFLNSASTTGTCLQEGTVKQPIASIYHYHPPLLLFGRSQKVSHMVQLLVVARDQMWDIHG